MEDLLLLPIAASGLRSISFGAEMVWEFAMQQF
jgi:hypothetical protein